jgi:hypothetical protein
MARFSNEYRIILQNPNPPTGLKIDNTSRKWILLPTMMYKVLVPYPKASELNFYQETILKLFMSGPKSVDYLSSQLLLDEKFVSYILNELRIKLLLTQEGLITEEGRLMIENQEEGYDLKIGYIFYDLLNQSYWQSFIFDEDLQCVDINRFDEPYAEISYGDIGNPRYERCFIIPKIMDKVDSPTTIEILKTLKNHQNRVAYAKYGVEYKGDQNYLPRNLKLVKDLHESEMVYLATYLFLPKDIEQKSHWQVCYPIDGGVSSILRQRLDHLKDKNEPLKKWVDSAYDHIKVFNNEWKSSKEEKDQAAYQALEAIFSENIKNYPLMLNQLMDVQGFILKQLKRKKPIPFDQLQGELKENLIKIYEILENSLFILANDYDHYFKMDYLNNSIEFNRTVLSSFAEHCGFEDNEELSCFKPLFGITKNTVKYYMERKDLQSLLAVNLLMSKDISEHPFFTLSQSVPDYISFLYGMKNKRDDSSHSSDQCFEFEDVVDAFKNTIYIIAKLFNDLTYHEENANKSTWFDDSSIDSRLYTVGLHEVESQVGSSIRNHDLLYQTLVDCYLSVEKKDGKYIVNTTKALEFVFGILAKSLIDLKATSWVEQETTKTLQKLLPYLDQWHFQFDLETCPDTFKSISSQKIVKSFKRIDDAVLSTKVYIVLLSAAKNNDPLLAEIGLVVPQLLDFTVKVNDKRGHGNQLQYKASEAKDTFNQLLVIIKNLLPILNKYGVNK